MSNGILSLSNKTRDLLKQKHPDSEESSPETLLQGLFRPLHPMTYDDINQFLVVRAAILTKGGSGPKGLDFDGWKRILTSRQFGNSSKVTFVNFLQTSSKRFVRENGNPHSPSKL